MLRINTEERRKLFCVACCACCQGVLEGLFKCVICLLCLPCFPFLLCCNLEDRTSNYDEDVRMFDGARQNDSDESSEWSDDSSQWFTARSFKRQSTGADKDKFEEFKPLLF